MERFIGFILLCLLFPDSYAQGIYITTKGDVNFTSDAPLELIEAASDDLKGLLKVSDRSFAFRVNMTSFEGFNSSLQKTHFNENYLESDKYPHTTFEGKIIEEVDLTKPGSYKVRGKGKFTCHGIEQERIVRCTINVSSNKITIISQFSVLLDDHNIKIPSVVSQKIAEEILVDVEIFLVPK